ncbi:MAG: glycoside hydrolase family 88 protein [Opitutales bacterium]|nr:glycoside hydrolase family 88 protein [Opitutales bacterium]
MNFITKSILYFIFLNASLMAATDYLETAIRVADKIIRDSSFDTKIKEMQPVNGLQVIDFHGYWGSESGIYYAVSEIEAEESDIYDFGISAKGPIRIWVDKQLVYENESMNSGFSREIAYELHQHADSFQCSLDKGRVSVWVETVTSENGCGFELQPQDSHGMLDDRLNFDLNSLDLEGTSFPWVVSGPYAHAQLSTTDAVFPEIMTEESFRPWRTIGNLLGPVLSVPEGVDFRWHAYTEWHYSNGATLWSMLYLADVAGLERLQKHVEDFCKFTLLKEDLFRAYHDQYNMRRVANFRMFRMSMLDDSSAPALPFIELYLRGKIPHAKEVIDRALRQAAVEQVRLEDGTLARPEPEYLSVWADDMFMAVPFLIRASEMKQDSQFLDLGLEQILLINRHLYVTDKDLYFHGWFDSRQSHSIAHWGRANGWCAWAIADALMKAPQSHPLYLKVLDKFSSHMNGLATLQGNNGLWHQVLDHPDSWEETSCTAMFLLAMARGVRLGWIDRETFMPVIQKAWDGLKSKIEADGKVAGICQGTGIGESYEFYYERKARPHDPRGVGAVITAAIEMHLLHAN